MRKQKAGYLTSDQGYISWLDKKLMPHLSDSVFVLFFFKINIPK